MTNTDRIVHYMAKESLFKGIHGKLLESIGIIKVYRTKSNPRAVTEAIEILKNGGVIGIFPEGTRNKTNQELLKFRHGAVAIAKQANVPIVPFVIRGDYKLFQKGLFYDVYCKCCICILRIFPVWRSETSHVYGADDPASAVGYCSGGDYPP